MFDRYYSRLDKNYTFKDFINTLNLKEKNINITLAQVFEFNELDYMSIEKFNSLIGSNYYDKNKLLNRLYEYFLYDTMLYWEHDKNLWLIKREIKNYIGSYLNNLWIKTVEYDVKQEVNLDERYEETESTISEGTQNSKDNSDSLNISNDTPGDVLNIENIKAGDSASSIEYSEDNDIVEQLDTNNQDRNMTRIHTRQGNTGEGVAVMDVLTKELNLQRELNLLFVELCNNLKQCFNLYYGSFEF